MAKKFIPTEAHISKAAGLAAIASALNNCAAAGLANPEEILRDSFPVITDPETGEDYTSLIVSVDDQGVYSCTLADGAPEKIGTITLHTIYSATETLPQATGEPYATPLAIYAQLAPDMTELMGMPKLKPIVERVLLRQIIAATKKTAKADYDGTAQLSRDRIATFITGSGTIGGIEKAWIAVYPAIRDAIKGVVKKKSEVLRAAGKVAAARNLEATFSDARLDKASLKACLSSEQAAKVLFPAMPQTQWENMLQFAIAYAPKHRIRKAMKGADGKSLKDESGAVIYDQLAAPQSPAIFQQWLETRSQALADVEEEAVSFDFSGLTA